MVFMVYSVLGSSCQFLLIVSISLIKSGNRIVAQNAVLYDQSRRQRLGVSVKQAVVAYAQSNYDVQICSGLVQQLSLKDRIAYITARVLAGSRYAHVHLLHGAYLASDPIYFKAMFT